MFLGTKKKKAEYTRISKLGAEHRYSRNRTYAEFKCDGCGVNFSRLRGSMDPKRLNNNYFHVCETCNPKKFAQQKAVESRKPWDMPASSLKKLGKL
jgi:hypothetical protein